jgi:hypothetical protein
MFLSFQLKMILYFVTNLIYIFVLIFTIKHNFILSVIFLSYYFHDEDHKFLKMIYKVRILVRYGIDIYQHFHSQKQDNLYDGINNKLRLQTYNAKLLQLHPIQHLIKGLII